MYYNENTDEDTEKNTEKDTEKNREKCREIQIKSRIIRQSMFVCFHDYFDLWVYSLTKQKQKMHSLDLN